MSPPIGMTAVAVLVAMIALVAIAALGHCQALIPNAPDFVIVAGKVFAYLVLTLAGAGAPATLYRDGPSRERARWVWLIPTIGFGIYVAEFGNDSATCGSLGTGVVTLAWLYLSSYILLFGVELNAELEHQTARDTMRQEAPRGARGAWVADHVVASDEGGDGKPGRDDVPSVGAQPQSPGAGDFAASPVGARAARVVGFAKVGWAPSIA